MASLPDVPRRTKSGKLVKRNREAASTERPRSFHAIETNRDSQIEGSPRNSTIGAPLSRSNTQPDLQPPKPVSDRSRSTHSSLEDKRRRSSYLPTVPSPLNPSKSTSSISTSDSGKSAFHTPTGSSGNESGNSQNSTGQNEPLLALEAGAVNASLRQGPQPKFIASGRPDSPKYLSDLGRDYSRYPSSSSDLSGYSRTATPANLSQVRLLGSTHPSTLSLPLRSSVADSSLTLNEKLNEKFDYPDDSLGAAHPYFGGEKGFILYPDEVEDDDIWHNPLPDDDKRFKPHFSDYLGRKSTTSGLGGLILLLGLICLFIVVPVLTFTGHTLENHAAVNNSTTSPNITWAYVNNRTYPLLKNIRQGLIDPDTPQSAYSRTSAIDGSELKLVFSDEFRTNNRTFYPGDDPFWTAQNIWYGATGDLEWYDPDAVTTFEGTLQLRLDQFNNHDLQYRSGMLNSWNQMCFKGGVFEVSVSLPGPGGVAGLWPGVWSMGNLGRPGFRATTDGMWPYSYSDCDVGITPNQSDPDGLSFLPGQKLPSCTCPGQEHPNPGTGRGAPEIDILEASANIDNQMGVITQSYQIAPFDVLYRPNYEFMALPNPSVSGMNPYTGGVYQQAISATTVLNNSWYDGINFQKYAYEYTPGGPGTGQILWFVGDEQTFIMDGRAVGQNGNVGARIVSEEPMAMVLNLGFSNSWTAIQQQLLKFPTIMRVDYVRIYQNPDAITVTCDPPGYPTTDYIKNHPKAYLNPNMTLWNETGYGWPTNKVETNC